MSHASPPGLPVFTTSFEVTEAAIDSNGHVNNVCYVQWMQELAIQHWEAVGGKEINVRLGSTWFARSHKIEYLRPAHLGDTMVALTWVASIGRVRSTRRYAFFRKGEQKPLATGETDWVFVDVQTGRPKSIPASMEGLLPPQATSPSP